MTLYESQRFSRNVDVMRVKAGSTRTICKVRLIMAKYQTRSAQSEIVVWPIADSRSRLAPVVKS